MDFGISSYALRALEFVSISHEFLRSVFTSPRYRRVCSTSFYKLQFPYFNNRVCLLGGKFSHFEIFLAPSWDIIWLWSIGFFTSQKMFWPKNQVKKSISIWLCGFEKENEGGRASTVGKIYTLTFLFFRNKVVNFVISEVRP